MNYKKWINAILINYRYFDSMCRSLDKQVKKKCLNSNNISQYHTITDSIKLMDNIIELNQRKANIIGLKKAVDKAVLRLSKIDMKILVLYYFDNVGLKVIANMLKVSPRTLARYKKVAIDRFKNRMFAFGYTEENLGKLFKNELWAIANRERYSSEDAILIRKDKNFKDVYYFFNSLASCKKVNSLQ